MGSSGRNENMGMKEAAEYMLSNSVNLNRTVMSALLCVNCRRSTKNWVVLFKCRHIICQICIDMASTNTQSTNGASMEGESHCPACNVAYEPKTDMKNKDGMKQNFNVLKDFLLALRANLAQQQRTASIEPTINPQLQYPLDQAPVNAICENYNGATSERYKAQATTTEQLQNIGTLSMNDVSASSSAVSVYIPRPSHNSNEEITASTEIDRDDDEDLINVTPDKHVL